MTTAPKTRDEAEAFWLTWYAGATPEEKKLLEDLSQSTKSRFPGPELMRLSHRPFDKMAPGEQAAWSLLAAHRLDYLHKPSSP